MSPFGDPDPLELLASSSESMQMARSDAISPGKRNAEFQGGAFCFFFGPLLGE